MNAGVAVTSGGSGSKAAVCGDADGDVEVDSGAGASGGGEGAGAGGAPFDPHVPSFPLEIRPSPDGGMEIVESEFNGDFIVNMLPKLDWAALSRTAAELGVASLPDSIPDGAASDEPFLRSVHSLIMDVHVKDGSLVCRRCGKVYPIRNGVPNMLLSEDEV